MKQLLATGLFMMIVLCNGQFYSPPTTMRTPYGNVTTPGHYMPMYYGSYQLPTVFKRAKLTLVLKNDSVLNIQAKFDAREKQNTITFKGKKGMADKVYKPADTKSITRLFSSGELPMKGIPADSCWLFKVVVGKINGYSNVPMHSEASVIAIQEGEGTIVILTKDNLLAMMPERNEKLDKLIGKKKFIEAIKLYNNPKS